MQFTFVGVSLSESFYGNLWEFTSKLFFFIINHLHHEHKNFSFLQIISLSLLNSVLDWLRFLTVSLIPALCHTCNLLPDHVLKQQIYVMIHHIVHTTCNYICINCTWTSYMLHVYINTYQSFVEIKKFHLRSKWVK